MDLMILSCQNLCKAFGEREILRQASFHVEEHDKAAIVGINGAGKTTLLRIIIGELAADSGEVTVSRGKTVGYLAQQKMLDGQRTIREELNEAKQDVIDMEERLRSIELEMKHASGSALESLMEQYHRVQTAFEQRDGYGYRSEITGVLKGLGFHEEDFEKRADTLSGGQKTRVALGKLLLSRPDIILLDEPTNHLDMTSVAWLETYLMNYKGTVIIVSHDRYFLNRVVNKVIEIDQGHVTSFSGNYSAYAQKKKQLREIQLKAYLNQQQEIKHQEEVIARLRSFNREKSIRRAESREKLLGKMEVLEKPVEADTEIRLTLEPKVTSGIDVLNVEHLAKAYREPLFSDLNFQVRRGEKVAIIGDNGTGKTTLLKIINRMAEADAGRIQLGSKVQIGYYDQEHEVLHSEKTLFEELSDASPNLNNTEVRNILAAFLFTGDDVFKRIRDLSGGEQGRVALAKLMLSKANFLILDEPTNHLDIVSREILEDALARYTGTVLYVSHDRYFINQTATRILDLKNRTLVNYLGNYDYYLEKNEELTELYAPAQNVTGSAHAPSASAEDRSRRKEEQARERRRQNELKKNEAAIQQLEERDREIDRLLEQEEIFTDVGRCTELTTEKADITARLEELYEQWEALAE